MNVSEIRATLEGVPDDAELKHLWTQPIGEPENGQQKYTTKLYFTKEELRLEARIHHFKDVSKMNKKPAPKKKKVEEEKGLTFKLGKAFRKS